MPHLYYTKNRNSTLVLLDRYQANDLVFVILCHAWDTLKGNSCSCRSLWGLTLGWWFLDEFTWCEMHIGCRILEDRWRNPACDSRWNKCRKNATKVTCSQDNPWCEAFWGVLVVKVGHTVRCFRLTGHYPFLDCSSKCSGSLTKLFIGSA